MSYSFTIGNAEPYFEEEDFYACWRVRAISHPEAPSFPNDEMAGQSNARHPSYSGWYNFCEAANILPLFYNERKNMKAGHPGIQRITPEDYSLVKEALKSQQAKATLPPGFSGYYDTELKCFVYPDDGKYDAVLARLIWLEWWMRYALETCKLPAIRNT